MNNIIKEIRLNKLATYTSEVIMNPSNINFCYGSNGSGKTSLSNLMGDYIVASESKILWENNKMLPTLVYNKKFVENNFGENPQIIGIFTLGKESTEALAFIEENEQEKKHNKKIFDKYKSSIDKLKNDSDMASKRFEDSCWAMQQSFGDEFKSALIGFRKSKTIFAEKCLDEFSKMNEKDPPRLQDIEELYLAAFSDTKTEYPLFDLFDLDEIERHETCALLEESISGSSESPLGTFIEFLQNSDWVMQGIKYAVKSNQKCPYCQQHLSTDIQNQLELFFDESYEKKIKDIKKFYKNYKLKTDDLLKSRSDIIGNSIISLEYELLDKEYTLLQLKIQMNEKKIEEKIDSPAIKKQIDSIVPNIKKNKRNYKPI